MSGRALEEVSTQVPADDFGGAGSRKFIARLRCTKRRARPRTAAERDVKRLREQLEERDQEVQTLRREMVQLRRDREEIRGRVEKMLHQMEAVVGASGELARRRRTRGADAIWHLRRETTRHQGSEQFQRACGDFRPGLSPARLRSRLHHQARGLCRHKNARGRRTDFHRRFGAPGGFSSAQHRR